MDPRLSADNGQMDLYTTVRWAQRCHAHSSRTGQPCKRWASRGSFVCASHGGATRRAKTAAVLRLAEAAAWKTFGAYLASPAAREDAGLAELAADRPVLDLLAERL